MITSLMFDRGLFKCKPIAVIFLYSANASFVRLVNFFLNEMLA